MADMEDLVADVNIVREGFGLFLFHPLTIKGAEALADGFPPEHCTYFGNALAVETRYAVDAAMVLMRDFGLVVE